MLKLKLREAIAREAARLVLRGKVSDYGDARKRAARWLSRRKVDPDNMPTNAEIQAEIYTLAGWMLEAPADGQETASLPDAAIAFKEPAPPPPLSDSDAQEQEHTYHPDAFAVMHMLLSRLERVPLDLEQHPEGDALYHSLQVYELGLQELPYDEEFLLACLLHDVGLGIDRRFPVEAAVEALAELVSPRTLHLIEFREKGLEYLKTGRAPKSLRKSEHFDDLVLLARCDRDGRVPGAQVGTSEEALEYIAGLNSAWDDA